MAKRRRIGSSPIRLTRRHFLRGAVSAAGLMLLSGEACIKKLPPTPTATFKDVDRERLPTATPTQERQPLTVGEDRQLFLDDYLIAESRGLHRVMHPAQRHPANPVLSPDPEHPWENHRAMFPCLLYDAEEKVYKMWYWAMAYENVETRIAYATSTDLVHWEKPILGIIEYKGSAENNLVYGLVGDMPPIVLKEPDETDPGKVYKMLLGYQAKGSDRPWAAATAFSADGLHWETVPPVMGQNLPGETWCALYDPALKQYVAFARHRNTPRTVRRQTSPDLIHWGTPEMVLAPDGQDPHSDGNFAEFYGLSVYKEGGLYVGFLWVFHTPAAPPPVQRSGTIDIQLVCSRDGRQWQRLGDRQPFLGLGEPGTWDSQMVWMGNFPVITLDQVYLVYAGWDHEHAGPREVKRTAIGLATIRRDGYVSLHADGEGQLLTRPLILNGSELHLNADARGGEIRVELLDGQGQGVEGYAYADCRPLTTDAVDHVVTWQHGSELSVATGQPCSLRIHIRQADLYSLWVEQGANDPFDCGCSG